MGMNDKILKQINCLIIGITVLILSCQLHGQITLYDDLCTHIDSIITTLPNGNGTGEYLQPGSSSRETWAQVILLMVEQNYLSAHSLAQTLNYRVANVIDPDGITYHVLERNPSSTSRHWGTYVFNDAALRPKLIVESPHPVYDRNTGNLGIRLFQQCSARAFFVAGTHRCNGTNFTPCDGTTTACSDTSAAYRYSDMAHVVLGPLHIATEVLYEDDSENLIIQPHGFTKGDSDPDIIMSNGTQYTPDNHDYLLNLRDNLAIVDPELTFKVAHVDQNWTRLIARTNTQGRLLNNSADPCYSYANSASGQFMHLEMAYGGLRNSEINWSKLIQAMAMTLPLSESSESNNSYLNFDGVDDYVKYNHSVNLKAFANRETFTIETSFWIDYWADVSNYDRILDLEDQFSVYLKEDGSFLLAVYSSDGTHYYYSDTGVITAGTWNHIAVCRFLSANGYRLRFYLNGNNVSADTTKIGVAIPAAPTSPALYIGRRSDLANGLDGDIDRVRITAAPLYMDEYTIADFYLVDDRAVETLIALEFEDTSVDYITENRGWIQTSAYLGSTTSGDAAEPQRMIYNSQKTDTTDQNAIPEEYRIPYVYPNPFNNVTNIRFVGSLSEPVKIYIYNLNGKQVDYKEIVPTYDGIQKISFQLNTESTGLYFYRIVDKTGEYTGKMAFIK